MQTKKKPGIAVMILAVMILIAGTGFGAVQILNGVRAYGNLPADSMIHHMEEYLSLMEDLEDLLKDPEKLKAMDVDAYLDSKLQNSDLTGLQEKDIRKLYADMQKKAGGGYLDQELAMNSLTREMIYYRQRIPNPAQTQIYMRNMLILGGASILVSLAIFLVLIRKRTPKEAD